ncbi:hypothetical protein BGZ50_004903 [Haplosporangium sp. Z 11]|nr:hypothetical protein BGZ50_004903 [Haplosporangium sp. Z 11]
MTLSPILQYPQQYYQQYQYQQQQQQQQQPQFLQSQLFYCSGATSVGTTTATAFRDMREHTLMMPRTGQGNGYGSAYTQDYTPMSSCNLSKAQEGVAPPIMSNQDQWATSTFSTYMKNITLPRATEPSTIVSASNVVFAATSAPDGPLPATAFTSSLQSSAPASMTASAPTSSTIYTSSLAPTIPSYLQAYISTEPLFSPGDKNSGSDKNLEDGDGSYRSLSSTLFSQSRELRQLLDRITSLDSVLDNFQRYFDDYQRRMTEGLISREEATRILETKAGEIVMATLSQRSQDMMGTIKERLEEALESQVNQMNTWVPSFQEQLRRVTRTLQDQVQQVWASQTEMIQELGLWKNSIEASVTNEIKGMKSMMELQAQMLAMIAEPSWHRLLDHDQNRIHRSCAYGSYLERKYDDVQGAIKAQGTIKIQGKQKTTSNSGPRKRQDPCKHPCTQTQQ